MILLWFIVGIALIFVMARYNESNKLFWTLLFSYIMGFAGTKMAIDLHRGNKQSNTSFVQVCPTQESVSKTCLTFNQVYTNMMASKVTASNPVSQDNTPELNETNVILSKVSRKTRDQPKQIITEPPEQWLQKSSSTHHDDG